MLLLLLTCLYFCSEIPVFTEHPQKAVHARAGETVVLRCAVDCVPSPPIYQWFYNRTPLVSEKTPQLVLKNIHHGHKGLYCCRATNPHINDEKTKHVFSNFAELSINQYPIQGNVNACPCSILTSYEIYNYTHTHTHTCTHTHTLKYM